MRDSHDPFTGRELSPDQARERTTPVDPTDPRLGVPPDKFGMHATPLRTEDKRQAVMIMVFPPEELRDQPYSVVEAAIFAQGAGLLRGIATEIYKSYTSEPLEPSAVRNIAENLTRHAESMRAGGSRG